MLLLFLFYFISLFCLMAEPFHSMSESQTSVCTDGTSTSPCLNFSLHMNCSTFTRPSMLVCLCVFQCVCVCVSEHFMQLQSFQMCTWMLKHISIEICNYCCNNGWFIIYFIISNWQKNETILWLLLNPSSWQIVSFYHFFIIILELFWGLYSSGLFLVSSSFNAWGEIFSDFLSAVCCWTEWTSLQVDPSFFLRTFTWCCLWPGPWELALSMNRFTGGVNVFDINQADFYLTNIDQ